MEKAFHNSYTNYHFQNFAVPASKKPFLLYYLCPLFRSREIQVAVYVKQFSQPKQICICKYIA
jgi:hypothetical protein